VAAQQQTTISASIWASGPKATGDATYSGSVDQPQSTTTNALSGWVVDTSATGWSGIDDVQILNGLMDAGGQMVAHPTFQINRPDVAAALNNPYWAASGWSATIPTGAYGPGSVLYVYAHTPDKGWWYQQVIVSVPISAPLVAGPRLDIEAPTPLATVHARTPYTMHGSAYDPQTPPDRGTGIDRVQVYLNGDRQSGIYIGDATLGLPDQFAATAGPQFANAGWQLTFESGSWLDTVVDDSVVRMTVYAHSSITNQETRSQTSIVITIP
jgi:hypothetical protein